MLDKTYLVIIIVGITILLVLAWLCVDFIIYYRRRKATREAKIYMFYTRHPNIRLNMPPAVRRIIDSFEPPPPPVSRGRRQSSFKRLLSFFTRNRSIDSEEMEIIPKTGSFDYEDVSRKANLLSSQITTENETAGYGKDFAEQTRSFISKKSLEGKRSDVFGNSRERKRSDKTGSANSTNSTSSTQLSVQTRSDQSHSPELVNGQNIPDKTGPGSSSSSTEGTGSDYSSSETSSTGQHIWGRPRSKAKQTNSDMIGSTIFQTDIPRRKTIKHSESSPTLWSISSEINFKSILRAKRKNSVGPINDIPDSLGSALLPPLPLTPLSTGSPTNENDVFQFQ